MKHASVFILLLTGSFCIGYIFGSNKGPIAPDNFNQAITSDGTHPDQLWGYRDSLSNRIVLGFTPVEAPHEVVDREIRLADTAYWVKDSIQIIANGRHYAFRDTVGYGYLYRVLEANLRH